MNVMSLLAKRSLYSSKSWLTKMQLERTRKAKRKNMGFSIRDSSFKLCVFYLLVM
jgi:hypothetical protein